MVSIVINYFENSWCLVSFENSWCLLSLIILRTHGVLYCHLRTHGVSCHLTVCCNT